MVLGTTGLRPSFKPKSQANNMVQKQYVIIDQAKHIAGMARKTQSFQRIGEEIRLFFHSYVLAD